MRTIVVFIALCASIPVTLADVYVRGHTRSDGTYVQPHYRTNPNNSTYDNYSTRGNTNPYTGRAGTVDPNRDFYGSQPGYGGSQPTYGGSTPYCYSSQPNYGGNTPYGYGTNRRW
jgi:hypothetical protein